ncbi:MAG: hypothetical protein ACXWC4_20085 [Telluria sp.]
MNFSFLSPEFGCCLVKLRASGRYGFVLPKKIEITRPDGVVATFLYHNCNIGRKNELRNRTLVRLAVAQFLGGAIATEPQTIDDEGEQFAGELVQIRSPDPAPAPLRVRPGAPYGRRPER